MAFGFIVLLVAGICQGSFGLGYKNHKPFSWSVFWGIYDIMCIITSTLFVLVLAPKYFSLLTSGGVDLAVPLLCGAMWGLSAIGFSKGIDKIGMSLVYGISMGISTIVGSVTPMIIERNITTSALFWSGLVVTLIGVILVTIAGVKRDGEVKGSKVGVVLSIFSGIGSGFMNVGFSKGESITETLQSYNYSDLAISSAKWLPVLVGGCIAGLIYCIFEAIFKKEMHTATETGSGKCAVKLFGVSIIWYLALILYGFSTSLLGDMGSTVGWILFNALALIISVFWGLKTGEWKGKKKTTLFIGCGVLIAAWILIALA